MLHRIDRPLFDRRHMLGHAEIDGDHMAIAEGWLRAVNCEPIAFPFFIARLKRLMKTHFDHEAALMLASGGSLCECHRKEHLGLLQLCDEASALNAGNWRQTQSLLRKTFPKLMRNHIAEMDQIAVLFLNERQAIRKIDHD